jgi:NAD(P)-dependent dehydrogenase (short-subunit alcohol dehydrogenase family)
MPQETDLFSIRGKTALVTGGAQGMGRMIADGLVRAGATVYITSRKAEICERAAREMAAFGQCFALPGELTAPEDVATLARRLGDHAQALHILINNAGRTWGAPLETFPDKAWAGVMAVNVQTPFTLVRDLLPLLKAAASAEDPARVINIGSLAGRAVEKPTSRRTSSRSRHWRGEFPCVASGAHRTLQGLASFLPRRRPPTSPARRFPSTAG